MSNQTWKLLAQKAEVRWIGDRPKEKRLKKEIKKALKQDRQEYTDKAAAEIANMLENGNVKGAFGRLQEWYKEETGKAQKPTFEDAEKLSAEYKSLFKREEPPGESLPLHIEPFHVDDNPPDEMEIVKALRKMNTGKSPRAT